MKRKPRIIAAKIAAFFVSLCIPLISASALAQSSYWSELGELFYDTYLEAKTYLDQLITEEFGEDAPAIQEAVDEALGALGLSDPLIVEEQIKEGVINLDEGLELDLTKPPAVVRGSEFAKEVDRQRLRSHSSSVIGQEGQEFIQEKLSQISTTIVETQELGYAAEEAISTQEAVKKLALQNSKETELLGALHTEVINSRIDTQFNADVLANISQTLDEERKARLNDELNQAIIRTVQSSQAELF
ncbi:MAG: hypothetical protein F6K31_07875 [Symploca sp. SIO2G7]|nr:hypothetical protein [Symploca sp. SIO2G7]